MIIYNKNNKVEISKIRERKKYIWFIKISILALCLSLLLTLFSEIILHKSNVIVAVILLVVFMFLNVFSDMIGLAITSCQIEELKKQNLDKKIFEKCLRLIKSSDKVSSILCDVVGDICGILCGVSGTMIAYIISNYIPIETFNLLLGAFISALIAGLTVLFKAISKNYAVNHASEIVKKTAKILLLLKFQKKDKNHKSRLNREDYRQDL